MVTFKKLLFTLIIAGLVTGSMPITGASAGRGTAQTEFTALARRLRLQQELLRQQHPQNPPPAYQQQQLLRQQHPQNHPRAYEQLQQIQTILQDLTPEQDLMQQSQHNPQETARRHEAELAELVVNASLAVAALIPLVLGIGWATNHIPKTHPILQGCIILSGFGCTARGLYSLLGGGSGGSSLLTLGFITLGAAGYALRGR